MTINKTMKSYKFGDIVVINKKIPDWYLGWTDEMDEYIGNKSIVMNYSGGDYIELLLKTEYDYRKKHYLNMSISYSYSFPVKSIDNRKDKIKRILEK